MLIEASIPLHVRLASGEVRLRPGRPVRFLDADGRKLLARAPGKVHCVTPEPPLQPGWLIVYNRNRHDRIHDGIVSRCEWDGRSWTVQLTSGTALPLGWVTSVGKTDASGQILAAWMVREHGHNGEGTGRP